MMPIRGLLHAALAVNAAGCLADGPATEPELRLGPLGQFVIRVADFTLPLMTDACFSVTVYDTATPPFDPAHQVSTHSTLCTSQHGSPGFMLDYVGICAPGGVNAVRLELDDVYMGGEAGQGGVVLPPEFYLNPCAADSDACVLTAPCTDDTTYPVDFDLTVASHPDVGIFDTRVRLGDIFCAASLDCEEHGGATLEYLTDPISGLDGPTAVLGFTCSGGMDAAATYLYLDDLVISCTNGWTATVDPSGPVGYTTPIDPHGLLFAAAINRGDANHGSSYWNVLLGLNLEALGGAGTCTLTTQGAATEYEACETRTHSRFPVIRWEVELTSGGVRTCGRHALNASDGAVSTFYTPMSTPTPFDYRMERGTGGVVAPLTPLLCGDP